VIADLSANHVERHALLCGYSVERVRLDYGIDLIVHTYTREGAIENGRLLFQLKATDRLSVSADGRTVSCRVERADLNYWLGEQMPVILILYNTPKDVAYWCHVQEHLVGLATFDRGKAAVRVTVRIPRGNVLDRRIMKLFASRKNAIVTTLRGRIQHAD
jgi:hypothetical protein